MHFTDDQQRYRIIEDIPSPANGQDSFASTRRVLYLANRKPRICNDPKEGCGAAIEYKDKIAATSFNDYVDGTLTRIIIYKKRFICQNPKCKKIYTVRNPIDINKGDRARDAAIKIVTEKSATMQELAKQGKFSKALGSSAISTLIAQLDGETDLSTRGDQEYVKRVNALRKLIKNYCLKNNLLYIPFEYKKQWRCLVCSCDFIKNECFLLDVLESDELKLIEEFTDRITDKAIIAEVHCNENDGVIECLKKSFSNTEILIPRRCMLDAFRRYCRKKRQQNMTINESAYQKMRSLIHKQSQQTWAAAWEKWRDSLVLKQRVIFDPVNEFIIRNWKTLEASFGYEFEASFIDLLNEIKKMRPTNFELMRIKLLFANHSHFDKSYENELVDAVKHIHAQLPTKPINNFGVNISDLVAELRAERMNFNIECEDDEN